MSEMWFGVTLKIASYETETTTASDRAISMSKQQLRRAPARPVSASSTARTGIPSRMCSISRHQENARPYFKSCVCDQTMDGVPTGITVALHATEAAE